MKQRIFCFTICISLLLPAYFSFNYNVVAAPQLMKPKNFIMMVMDGTNSDSVTLARWYKGKKLALDDILVGGARTYSYRSAITDSAAAGTALATGRKSIVHAIGMAPTVEIGMLQSGNDGKKLNPGPPVAEDEIRQSLVPVPSILEAAREAGKATGIISTSPIQHATPASFSAHVENREDFQDIAEQQVYQGMDVVLGGGMKSLLPASRNDKEDLVKTIFHSGYVFADNKNIMDRATNGKLWGSFSRDAIANEFDRKQFYPQQPSLANMTTKALKILGKNKDGFFLFIEGSKVDWAAHLNDPVGMVSEILSFDAAVKSALDFAKKDGETLVIAVTDHGNSGLTIGSHSTDKTYATRGPSEFIKPLKKAKVTLEGAMWLLKKDRSNLREVAEKYGLTNLTKGEWNGLKSTNTEIDLQKRMSKLLGKRANIGFTTYGHTGEDVFLYAYGPGKPAGLINNIDIAPMVARNWGIDLQALSKQRFVDAEDWYKKQGYQVKLDRLDPANPVFVAEKTGMKLEYPANKNYMIQNGENVGLKGVTVIVGDKAYISVQ